MTTRAGSLPVVNIRIDRLSLHGYTPMEQHRFMRTLNAALSRLGAQKRDWQSLASRDVAELQLIQASAGASAEQAAELLARQLFTKLSQRPAEREHA